MPVVPQLARLTNPLFWRSPARNLSRLLSFARAEWNTLVELEQAANLTPSPDRAAAYLRHAADEARHARMFVAHAKRTAHEHGLPLVSPWSTDTSHLYRQLGEPVFLAFMHQGEARGQAQFRTYQDHLRSVDPRGSAMFAAILVDEEQHASYTRALLTELESPGPALGRAWRWEAWRTLRSLQRGTARTLFTVSFLLLWPLWAMSALYTRWVRPETVGWR